MKKIISLSLALLLTQSAFFFAALPVKVSAQIQEVLDNAKVVDMVKTGLSQPLIIAKIKASKGNFDTSTAAIKELKKAGVSDAVILEMVQNTSSGGMMNLGNNNNQSSNNSGRSNNNSNQSSREKITLTDGTPIKLRLGKTMSSADANTGETVDFEILEEVKIDDFIIIPRGGIALGTVTRAKPKGRMGKGGKLDINIDSVRLANGEKVPLRAVKETKGSGSTGAMTGAIVASSILFFPAAPFFLLMKGKDITIPKGTEITAYVNGDISLDPGKFDR